jgi:hypothetical protein
VALADTPLVMAPISDPETRWRSSARPKDEVTAGERKSLWVKGAVT